MHVHAKSLQWCQLFKTIWTIACQTPLSMGFSRQKDWSGLPSLPPGDLPDSGTEPTSLMFPALAGGFFTIWKELVPAGKPLQSNKKVPV